jgi:hypothetical protein
MSNVYSRRAQEETVDRVLAGIQQVVSFEGRSQYAAGGGGASTCGLAALNCARVILGRERDGLKGEELVCSMMGRETMEASAHMPTLLSTSSSSSSSAGDTRHLFPLDWLGASRRRRHLRNTCLPQVSKP